MKAILLVLLLAGCGSGLDDCVERRIIETADGTKVATPPRVGQCGTK